MEFLVDDAGTGRHPLDIALANAAAATRGIPVFELSRINERDRLEAAMGMRSHSPRLGGWTKLMRPSMIEQQEGTEMLRPHAVVGEQGTHGEAVSNPVPAWRTVYCLDLLHRRQLLCRKEVRNLDAQKANI
ncbi:hypothetical protein A8U91_01555 [Halomonas elongata]|uniref:Uncharacterized protein n=1 Tax=Halomonas elongata TaxID=2746 RepID=A0A1B8P4P8_HALEL|nr:hypothetical protein A8U91_01555 [Halomonas elongata]